MTAQFCAICISYRGPFTEQPLGKNDALVNVCKRCSEDAPKPPRFEHRVIVKPVVDPRHERIRANRERLTAQGLCMDGRNHGPATSGRLCMACRVKQRGRGRG